MLRCLLRVKTPARTILTCDASSLAGLPPGRYREWDQEFEVLPTGKIVVPGTLTWPAPASSPMPVWPFVLRTGVSLADALDMAGARPRRLLGLPPRRLEPGAAGRPGPVRARPGKMLRAATRCGTVVAGRFVTYRLGQANVP